MSVFRYQLTDRPETLVMIAEGCDLPEAERVLRMKFAERVVRVWCEGSDGLRIGASTETSGIVSAGGFTDLSYGDKPMRYEILPARRPPCKSASSMGAA